MAPKITQAQINQMLNCQDMLKASLQGLAKATKDLNQATIKVEKENIEEYESFITDYIGKVAETAVENGKLENFIFRRVNQNSRYNAGFTHMILWVDNDQSIPWSEMWDKTYPNLSKESRDWIWSKGNVLFDKLYTAYTTYVTGFSHAGEGVVNYVATYNLIKAADGKLNDYIAFEKNMKELICF